MKTVMLRAAAVVTAGLLLSSASLALAQPKDATPDKTTVKTERVKIEIPKQTRTYAEKTPRPDRERARVLFHQGNKLFEQRQVDAAYKLYVQAYAIWPHPRVLFNQAVSLGFLGRPLESARKFKTVLEYGPEPITDLRYKQASERYLELMGQLANLVVICNDTGAKLYVNGEPVGTAPFDKKITLGPGTHMITGNLAGKVPYSAQVRLEPGQLKRITVNFQAFTDLVRYKLVDRYHWSWPAAVTGVAAAALGIGLGLIFHGRDEVEAVEQEVNEWIDINGPEVAFPKDIDRENRAVTFQYAGWIMLGTAGAAAVAATVLWITRKKKVRYTVGAEPSKSGGGVKISF